MTKAKLDGKDVYVASWEDHDYDGSYDVTIGVFSTFEVAKEAFGPEKGSTNIGFHKGPWRPWEEWEKDDFQYVSYDAEGNQILLPPENESWSQYLRSTTVSRSITKCKINEVWS